MPLFVEFRDEKVFSNSMTFHACGNPAVNQQILWQFDFRESEQMFEQKFNFILTFFNGKMHFNLPYHGKKILNY